MKELHAQGKTIEEIADCLKQIPMRPSIISAIKSAHASGYFPKLNHTTTSNFVAIYYIMLLLAILVKFGTNVCRCDLRILSDANVFFIETILKHNGLLDCFHEINCNPSFVDEEGSLRILPYHDFTSSSQACNYCPPNMCKVSIRLPPSY